jgi:hypothetical protein
MKETICSSAELSYTAALRPDHERYILEQKCSKQQRSE